MEAKVVLARILQQFELTDTGAQSKTVHGSDTGTPSRRIFASAAEVEMSYFGFLLRFLLIPIVVLAGVWPVGQAAGTGNGRFSARLACRSAIGLHVLIALIYTTPWDNYLVATNVWWYDPALVTGITLGWVPIEEYTFFILQPILAGLWLAFLMRRTEWTNHRSPDNGIYVNLVSSHVGNYMVGNGRYPHH